MTGSPLAGWPGGKSRLARRIVALMPAHHCYCEPFAGAAWVLFRKEPSPVECLNDLNNEIYNFFETCRAQTEALCARAELTFNSRAMRQNFLASLSRPCEDPVERAFRFYFLLRSSYRGLSFHGGGTAGAIQFKSGPLRGGIYSASRFMDDVRAAAKRLDRVCLENLPWQRLLDIYDRERTFFYLDPPYYGTRVDYGAGWRLEDYAQLAGRLKSLRAKFICSLNKKPELEELFSSFERLEVKTNYSTSRKNRRVQEVLYANFELEE